MNDEEFRLLEEIEEDHWWFVGKRLLLRALLRREPAGVRMLDLGCGTGGVLRDWRGQARCVGADRSELGLRICAQRGFDTLTRADLSRLPFRPSSFDLVLMLDVIEHVEDDVGLVRRAAELCAPGGRVVVLVPAFPMLWSQHDETFEHHRRYTARALRRTIEAAGLEPLRITHTNTLLFPIAAVWRILSHRLGLGRFAPRHDFWPVPRWLNATLVQLYRLEAWWLARADLPFGVSVGCIARVPEPATPHST